MTHTAESIRKGTRFNLHQREYEVCYIDADSVRYAAMQGGHQHPGKLSNLLTKLDAGEASITYQPISRQDRLLSGPTLTLAEESAASHRIKYLKGLKLAFGNGPWPREKLKSEIERIAAELEDEEPPSASTVKRWRKLAYTIDSTLGTMAPKCRERGKKNRFNEAMEVAVAHALEKFYLTGQRLSVKAAYDLFVGELALAADEKTIAPKGKLPSLRTFQRRAEALDPHLVVAKRRGARAADQIFRAAGQGIVASSPLEIVFGDGQLMDVLAVPKDLVAESITQAQVEQSHRPYITVFIDLHTRAILSYLITAIPFSAATVLRTFGNACEASGDAPRGVPDLLLLDNGCDYISDGLKRAARRTECHIQYAPPYSPNAKAAVERFIGELTKFIHNLPGTTFSNLKDRGDYDSERLACLTLDDLRHAVDEFISIYHDTVHGETKRTPLGLWRESIVSRPPRLIPQREMEAIARVPHRRMIAKGRVTVYGLEWFSPALATIEYSMRARKAPPLVDVLVDEWNLGSVYVQELEGDRTIILADSTRPNYAKGLTLWEHETLQAELKAAGERDVAHLEDHELQKRRFKLWRKLEATAKDRRNAAKQLARLRDRLFLSDSEEPANPGDSAPVAAPIAELESLPAIVEAGTAPAFGKSEAGDSADTPVQERSNAVLPVAPATQPVDRNAGLSRRDDFDDDAPVPLLPVLPGSPAPGFGAPF